jgi:DNA-binding SARP family transcriptional activator
MTAPSPGRPVTPAGGVENTAGPGLRIRLLGDFQLHRDGAPLLPAESSRTESLLGYLILNRDAPQARSRIAGALWPESTESQARTNLRHVLHNLRHAVADLDGYLAVTSRTVQWCPRGAWWLDVAVFDEAASGAEQAADDSDAVALLRTAVEVYRGDLLPGCFDEWIDGERQRLRGAFLAALRRLAGLLEQRREHIDAIRYAERLLHHDDLAEDTYRVLMRLHDASGDRARALRVYHACAATLERELGTQPSAQTRRQYEQLLAADRPAATDVPAIATDAPATATDAPATAARAAGPPLIGRGPQRARLTRAWRAAAAGDAQLVLLTGEAGIGKTRLIEEFRSWCGHHGAVTAAAGAYAAEGVLAYGLIVSWLRGEALAGRVRRLAPEAATELARLLPELLTELPHLPRPRQVPEGELRQRLFDAVARVILDPGVPTLLVADDLHWSDRESLRCVRYLLRARPQARLLVVAAARREDLPDGHPLAELVAALQATGRAVELPLDRFDPPETAELARRLTGADLDAAGRDRLYRETEGNPLFVTEALRAGWSAAVADGDVAEGGRLSPKVQAVIESRLVALSPPARDLLGVAATIGRDFTVDVLAEASGAAEDVMVGGLDELWRRRIIAERGVASYDFTHDKIRDVAYRALDPAQRRRHHRNVAEALRRRYAADPGPVSGQLAVHLERAGAIEPAVDWYARAAEAAQLLYAHVEAVRLFERALDLLATTPAGRPRDARELELLTAMAAPLMVVDGSAPRLIAVQERALGLAERLGVEPPPPLLRSLAVASLTRGDFSRAVRLGARLRDRGAGDHDPVLAVEAAYVLGIAEFWRGTFDAAREHFETAVDRYRVAERDTHLIRYGLDPRVVCMSRLANTYWFLGRPADAVRARDTALAWADEIEHPGSRSTALVFAALLSLESGDTDGVRRHTVALRGSGDANDVRAARLTADALAGYLEVIDGRPKPGLARIRRVVDAMRPVGPAPGAQASVVRVLLAACAAAGDARSGLAAADRALAAGDGVLTWESEIRRLRAEFLAGLGAPPADVAAELDRALAVARQQHARLLEMRAAASALRLGPAARSGS